LYLQVQEHIAALLTELEAAEVLLATLHLPEQQIHADAHTDNFLVEGDVVSGILDFEFSAFDW
jgi:Ser/Thr protein kinase RdoA (MazF antagonist)